MKIKMSKNQLSYKKVTQNILKIVSYTLIISGIIFLFLITLAFTPLPYYWRNWLANIEKYEVSQPDYIIMLGGGGMPSEDNLIRLYYTAQLGIDNPKAYIIIAHPKDSSVQCQMRQELMIRGIDSVQIRFASEGTNTQSQIMILKDSFPEILLKKAIVITSPEQIRRTLLAFRKAGFKHIGGLPSFSQAMDRDFDLQFNNRKLKGSKYIPEVGDKLSLRYNFWNYLKLEITCLRELTALAYYKLNGWI
jgi:uncharacterized SAM-binding protein YcdF (DUF218 family)